MKWLFPLVIIVAVSILLWFHQHNSLRDKKYQEIKKNMLTMKQHLAPGTTIGCNVDSNHVREFYECRYWLATNRIAVNNPAKDTQLIIQMNDERHNQAKLLLHIADTIAGIHDTLGSYFLVTTQP